MPVTHFALRGCPLEARVPWWRMTPFFVPEARGEEGSRHCASILAPATEAIDAEEQHRREMPPVRLASRERLSYSWDRSQERGRWEWSCCNRHDSFVTHLLEADDIASTGEDGSAAGTLGN